MHSSPPKYFISQKRILKIGGYFMHKANDNSEINSLQNQFTAYLSKSIKRRRIQYLISMNKVYIYETDIDSYQHYITIQTDYIQHINDSDILERALKIIKEKERYILLAHVIEGKTFAEIAMELHMGYKGVAAAYYRVLEKLRKIIGGNENEF